MNLKYKTVRRKWWKLSLLSQNRKPVLNETQSMYSKERDKYTWYYQNLKLWYRWRRVKISTRGKSSHLTESQSPRKWKHLVSLKAVFDLRLRIRDLIESLYKKPQSPCSPFVMKCQVTNPVSPHPLSSTRHYRVYTVYSIPSMERV